MGKSEKISIYIIRQQNIKATQVYHAMYMGMHEDRSISLECFSKKEEKKENPFPYKPINDRK